MSSQYSQRTPFSVDTGGVHKGERRGGPPTDFQIPSRLVDIAVEVERRCSVVGRTAERRDIVLDAACRSGLLAPNSGVKQPCQARPRPLTKRISWYHDPPT